MIKFSCKCGKEIKVADKHAGKKGKCPQCKEVVRVPHIDSHDNNMTTNSVPPKAQINPITSQPKKQVVEGNLISITGEKITFTCSNCEEVMSAPTDLAGKSKLCGTCGSNVSIPKVKTQIEDEPIVERRYSEPKDDFQSSDKAIIENRQKCENGGETAFEYDKNLPDESKPKSTALIESPFARGLIKFTIGLFIIFGVLFNPKGDEKPNVEEKKQLNHWERTQITLKLEKEKAAAEARASQRKARARQRKEQEWTPEKLKQLSKRERLKILAERTNLSEQEVIKLWNDYYLNFKFPTIEGFESLILRLHEMGVDSPDYIH